MLLLSAFEHQDYRFASAFSVLEEAISERAFPAASVAATFEGRLIALKAFGHFSYEHDSPAVTTDTLFDLASVTKVVATASLAMRLYERGLLDLDATVAAIVPEFVSHPEKDSRRGDVTLRMLLSHSSGLPAYEKLFLKARTREELLHAVFTMPLASDPRSRANYSDIGFILLGVSTVLAKLKSSPRSA
jgi:CubicO group peptidase (beta-lactamase class C family)